MTKSEAQDKIEQAIRYCWNHADSEEEEKLVAWMAEHVGRDFGLTVHHARYADGSVYFDVVR